MNLFPLALVLADIGDIIGSIVGIAFLVIWVIGQLAGAKKEAKPQAAQRPAEPPRPQPRQQAGRAQAQPAPGQAGRRAPAAAGGDPLRDQVEEFLRRAGRQQKPDQVQGQGPQAPPPRRRPPAGARDKIEVLVPEEPAARQRKPLAEPLRSQGKRGVGAPRPGPAKEERIPLRPVSPKHESVAEHVADHVAASTRSLAEHSAKLGQSVVTADEQFDVQLHTKFDHELGSLSQRHAKRVSEQQAATEPQTPAQQIAAMLSNPEGVRQAIVLNEILRRPSDRWE